MRIRLIHWHEAEADKRAQRLRELGYAVEYEQFVPALFAGIKKDPPAAIVIDLSRLPSQGRDVAMYLRQTKRTRSVPLVFVGGEKGKVSKIRSQLPDAVYASWPKIKPALQKAIAQPTGDPVKPSSALAGYSGTPLVKKLGIKPGAVVAIVDAPDEFRANLGDLPEDVIVRTTLRGRRDLTIWFVRSQRQLEKRIDRFAAAVAERGLWIVWPKKSSQVDSDLSQRVVRERGLAAGLVDYKVCAIDQTWSGLKFAVRKGQDH